MPAVPKVSPATGNLVSDDYLHTTNFHFRDNHGRAILLRGINFCSSSKAPHNQPSWSADGFWEEAEAGRGDFVGRPVDLEDGSADVHFARLKAWGFNCLRFVFTWEALEHEGPGKYDYAYIDYLVKVLYKCKEWGFRVYMDPHQDTWSRFTGGSGAPLWTLYACGMDPMNITPTFSAFLQHEYPSRSDPKPSSFPQMIWATNYCRFANFTIWTLFFAGKAFAPKCIIDGVNIQDWLQNHFIEACGVLAERLAKEPGLYDDVIIGWDSMNEPGEGMIGRDNLGVVKHDERLKKGPMPSPFDGMKLAMGEAVEVDVWTFTQMGPKLSGRETLDPEGTKLWLRPDEEATRGGGKWGWKRSPQWKLGECIWAQHGVWDPSNKKLLRPNYFQYSPSDPDHQVDTKDDYWPIHFLAYASEIRKYHPEAILFIQPPVFAVPPKLPNSFLKGRACAAPHYYDGLTLMTKHWNWFNADALGVLRKKYWTVLQALRVGEPAIRRSIQDQLGILKSDTATSFGDYPTLIGEIGCPYDLDDKKAYGYVDGGQGEGDYSQQQKAWDASLNATDGPNCLDYTMWTYCPENSHQWGDLWNNEDLSIFSPDDMRVDSYGNEEIDDSKFNSARTSIKTVNGSEPPSPVATIAKSSASSATLLNTPSNRKYTVSEIESGLGVTASLILDGARAIGAVCRPFPIMTVGTPDRIDFDIASSKFRLSVKVKAGDIASDEIATEIYLPFVHYAANLNSFSFSPSSSVNSSSANLLAQREGGSDRPSKASNPLKLDVDVSLSKGKYSLRGQTLKWKYPVPESAEEMYTIEVTRKGGAIVRDTGYVQINGWGDVCPSCNIA